MNPRHYILDKKGNPVVTDLMTWAKWFEKAERYVGLDQIGPYKVSTVFLGLDHQYGKGPPVLWETMTFSNPPDLELDQIQKRCSGSREQAEAMHREVCETVKREHGKAV